MAASEFPVRVVICVDKVANRKIIQKKIYVEGVGSADNPGSLSRFIAGISGKGYEQHIKAAYEECCKLNEDNKGSFHCLCSCRFAT
jgi:hypothetical protein